ncbi:MAG: IS1595 family transposase [Croceibacterium sp.]
MTKKSPSASPEFSVREFFARFPDEQACLDHIMAVRFGGTKMDCPKCGAEGQFHKLRDRRVYACPHCLFQIAPTANTILHDTRTPLVSWFYAMYLFCTTRHGVSGKELQRQLGVTYKTAYRIGQQIRDLTAKAQSFDALLSGHVELDEAYVGGRRSGGKRGRGAPGKKTIVMGLISRDGPMKAVVIPDVKKDTLREVVLDNVEPGSVVSTDELYSYNLLTGDGFTHGAVKHGAKEYAYYDYRTRQTFHVNTVEGFWRLFKASVRSTHVQISAKHMQRYLSEFTFRATNRQRVNGMFDLLVGAL